MRPEAIIDRRLFLAGAALSCLADGDGDTRDVRSQIDAAARAEGAERLALLQRIDARGLSRGARLDVAAAKRGSALVFALSQAIDPHARYALQLRLESGLDAAPDVLFRSAAARARRITAELDRLLRAEGLAEGSVADRLRMLARDPRYLYPDSDGGRDRALADMNRWLARARARLPGQLRTVPDFADRVTVRRMSPADEAAGRAGYRVLPEPGSSPGAYYVDLHDIGRRPAWSLPSVVHHEALPGHLLQLPLQARADPHPLRLRACAGFVEGWGIYAEQLAAEAGAYAGDRPAEIGYLQWMLFRLGRAMIDIGVNRYGWTDGAARDLLANLQGDPMVFAPFDQDVAKARSSPASFAAHIANAFGFVWLRAAARRRGADLRQLHDRLLADGAFPLALHTG